MTCSVVIHSCDKYEEAWTPFFALYRKYWSQCPFDTFLSTENEKPDITGVKVINTGAGDWSYRLHTAIEKINTDLVILLLEDFFFQQKVDEQRLNEAIGWMEKDSDLAVIYFNRITGYNSESSSYPGYYEMRPGNSSQYMCNCQAALWRKDVLLHATEKSLSPQDFEDYGYVHLDEKTKSMTFLCSINTRYDSLREGDVFGYILDRDAGYGIWSSKWLWNNRKLFKRENIPFYPSKLGVMKHSTYLRDKAKSKIQQLNRRNKQHNL